MDPFMKNLATTISVLANIAFWIVVKALGFMSIGLILTIVIIIATSIIPLGGPIAFVILKLTGKLTLSWLWLILVCALNAFITATAIEAFKTN